MELRLCLLPLQGHASVVELLLKADGVDVNKEEKDGVRLYTLPLLKVTRPWWSYC